MITFSVDSVASSSLVLARYRDGVKCSRSLIARWISGSEHNPVQDRNDQGYKAAKLIPNGGR